MATPTPGTFPSFPPYQPGALQYSGSEITLIVTSATATAAATYYDFITNIVGKAPSVMTVVNPTALDIVAFYQASSQEPRATFVGNLGIAAGNLPVGGSTSQLLAKNSANNYDASWFNISSLVSAGTGIAVSGSANIVVSLTGPAASTSFTAEGVLYGNGTNALGVTAAGAAGLPLLGNGGALAPAFAVLGLVGGGLNTTTLTQDGILYGNGTNTVGVTAAGTLGLPLLGNGTVIAPAFAVLSLAGGGLNTTILTQNGVVYGNGTNTVGITGAGATSLPLLGQGAANAPAYGVLPVIGGGHGTTTLTAHGVVLGEGTTTVNIAAAGATGTVFASNGPTSDPSFQAITTTMLPAVVPLLNAANTFTAGNTFNGTTTFGGSIILAALRVATTGTTATLSTTADYWFGVSVATAFLVNLPPSPATGLTYLIKDVGGNVSTTNILTVKPATGNIDNSTSFISTTALVSIGVTYSGLQWSIS